MIMKKKINFLPPVLLVQYPDDVLLSCKYIVIWCNGTWNIYSACVEVWRSNSIAKRDEEPKTYQKFGELVYTKHIIEMWAYLSLFLELNSTSSLAYTFFADLVAFSLFGWALDTNTINHSRSSFWTINFRRGLRIVLNSSRSYGKKWKYNNRITLAIWRSKRKMK